MSKFTKHFCMRSDDVIEYIREKMPDFFAEKELVCNEIGDGNINYVFRVKEKDGDRSLIVKHADVCFRNDTKQISVDRNRIEYEILQIQGSLCKDMVPQIYFYDPVMCCMVMEDIDPHKNLRYELIDHKTFSTFPQDITDFMVSTLIGTSDLVLEPEKKKELDKEFINPEMCEITERLVLEEPYKNKNGSNKITKGNEDFVEKQLYSDEALHLEVAKLKYTFQTKSQSLLHGDLHSGSIFVKEGSTKVLDPEFAFYGPAGYDVGNVIAHMIFAWLNAEVTMADKTEKRTYQSWIESSVTTIIGSFQEKALAYLKEKCHDVVFASEPFYKFYIQNIMVDTAGYCGLELIRRIVGSAKVKDITSLLSEEGRAMIERLCILYAKHLIMNRTSIKTDDYISVLKEIYDKEEWK